MAVKEEEEKEEDEEEVEEEDEVVIEVNNNVRQQVNNVKCFGDILKGEMVAQLRRANFIE